MIKEILVETALLGQGTPSLTDEFIMNIIPLEIQLAWVKEGKIIMSNLNEFIKFRNKSYFKRYNCKNIKNLNSNDYGYLTASATMYIADKLNIPIVVSAGIGGFSTFDNYPCSLDLDCILKLKPILLATSFKDMIDIKKSISKITKYYKILGNKKNYCDGYIFNLKKYNLSGKLSKENIDKDVKLIFNDIDNNLRFKNIWILKKAIKLGIISEHKGISFHPVVNSFFDNISNGFSSEIQVLSLRENISLAKNLLENFIEK